MSDKDLYIQKLHARLDQWNAKIDKLRAKADKVEAGVRVEYNKQMEYLQEKRKVAEAKLAEMREAGGDAWKDLKIGVGMALDAVEEAIKSASSRFK